MPAGFTYQDLSGADSIRLLLLQPRTASTDDEIHCKLQHVSLSECEDDLMSQYIALSYVWGSEEQQGIIFVEGTEFHVTANLFRALRSIRHESKELPLWVDAVCINQKNPGERSQQVRFMGSIYAAARNTIIYLGESDEESDRAIRALNDKHIADELPGGFADWESLKNCIVSSILSRPWFTRVWVLQELALSQNPIIQCGISRVRWGKLPNFLSSIEEIVDENPSKTQSIHQGRPETEQLMMDMQEAREKIQLGNINNKLVEKQQNLFDLVRWRSGLGAKDPRDIIFAHIGMVNHISGDSVDLRARNRVGKQMKSKPEPQDETGQMPLEANPVSAEAAMHLSVKTNDQSDKVAQHIAIDYEKTVAEVYNDFARALIEHMQNLSFITTHIEATYLQVRMAGLASWAPDWTLRAQHPAIHSNYYDKQPHLLNIFNDAHIFNCEKAVLGLLGSVITHIKETTEVINQDDPSFPRTKDPSIIGAIFDLDVSTERQILIFRKVYECWRKRLGPEVLPALVEKKMNDYRVSSLDGNSKFDPEKAEGIAEALGNRMSMPNSGRRIPSVAECLVSFSGNTQYNEAVQGRRVALLENGETALVPACAKKGDALCAVNLHRGIVLLRSYEAPNTTSIATNLRYKLKCLPKPMGSIKPDLYRVFVTFVDRLPVCYFTLVGGCLPDQPHSYLYQHSEQSLKWDHCIIELH